MRLYQQTCIATLIIVIKSIISVFKLFNRIDAIEFRGARGQVLPGRGAGILTDKNRGKIGSHSLFSHIRIRDRRRRHFRLDHLASRERENRDRLAAQHRTRFVEAKISAVSAQTRM